MTDRKFWQRLYRMDSMAMEDWSLVIEKVATSEKCVVSKSVLSAATDGKVKSDYKNGIVDTACRFSIMSEDWWEDYAAKLKELWVVRAGWIEARV